MEKENNNTGSPVKKRGRPRKNPPIEIKDITGDKKWGGHKKPLPPEKKRITFSCQISPETRNLIDILKQDYGIKLGREIDALVHRLAIIYGLIEDDTPTH